jgi:hypothetical protein
MNSLNRSLPMMPGFLLAGLIFILFSCEKNKEAEENKDPIELELLSGVIQKGPFI